MLEGRAQQRKGVGMRTWRRELGRDNLRRCSADAVVGRLGSRRLPACSLGSQAGQQAWHALHSILPVEVECAMAPHALHCHVERRRVFTHGCRHLLALRRLLRAGPVDAATIATHKACAGSAMGRCGTGWVGRARNKGGGRRRRFGTGWVGRARDEGGGRRRRGQHLLRRRSRSTSASSTLTEALPTCPPAAGSSSLTSKAAASPSASSTRWMQTREQSTLPPRRHSGSRHKRHAGRGRGGVSRKPCTPRAWARAYAA